VHTNVPGVYATLLSCVFVCLCTQARRQDDDTVCVHVCFVFPHNVPVQVEDIALCEAVQQGLQEPSYGVGRYAPGPEAPMYHFHSLMYAAVNKHLAAAA
jgi:hypothetical protein